MTFDSTVTLSLDVGGPTATDRLAATGTAALGGATLAVALAEGYDPGWLVPHTILTAGSVRDAFGRLDVTGLADGKRLAVTYTPTSVTVMAARSGDVNLDGVIDLLDVAGFIAADRFDSGAPAGWSEGDFNGDGLVDLLDAAEMATSGLYDAGPYATPVASIAPVPEPSAPLVLLLAPILAGVIGVGRFTAAQRSCRARSRRLREARIVA